MITAGQFRHNNSSSISYFGSSNQGVDQHVVRVKRTMSYPTNVFYKLVSFCLYLGYI